MQSKTIGKIIVDLGMTVLAKRKWARYNMDKKAKVTAMV